MMKTTLIQILTPHPYLDGDIRQELRGWNKPKARKNNFKITLRGKKKISCLFKNSGETIPYSHQQKMAEIKTKIKEAEEKNLSEELEKLKTSHADLMQQEQEFTKKEEEIRKKERLTPWNIDTICHDGKSKTVGKIFI